MSTHRYLFKGAIQATLDDNVNGATLLGLGPVVEADIELADDDDKTDLDLLMSECGFEFEETDPTTSVSFLRTATIAALNALTEDDVAVGDFAFSTDHGTVRCYATSPTGSSWEADATESYTALGGAVSSSLRYLDLSGEDVENSNDTGGWTQISPGYGFRLERVIWVANTAPGSTTIGIHKSGNVTPEASDTTDPGGANVWVRIPFSVEFSASDFASVSIDHAGATPNISGRVTTRRIFPE